MRISGHAQAEGIQHLGVGPLVHVLEAHPVLDPPHHRGGHSAGETVSGASLASPEKPRIIQERQRSASDRRDSPRQDRRDSPRQSGESLLRRERRVPPVKISPQRSGQRAALTQHQRLLLPRPRPPFRTNPQTQYTRPFATAPLAGLPADGRAPSPPVFCEEADRHLAGV